MSSTYGLPPWRPSLQKLPGAPSLRAGTACSGCALPARDSGGEAKAAGARRPRPRLPGAPAPPPARTAFSRGLRGGRAKTAALRSRRPAGRADRRAREDSLRGAAASRHSGSNPRGSGREPAGVAGQQRVFFFFWNSGCGPLTQQKRNESARAILTNKRVHSPLRRNLPFLIYVRFRRLTDLFGFFCLFVFLFLFLKT